MRTHLIVDCSNLLSRMFYAVPHEMHGGRPVGALKGFLKKVAALRELYGTSGFVFAFDSKTSLRKKVYPYYQDRMSGHSEKPGFRDKKFLTEQLIELRKKILPKLGMSNVFAAEGYEADDIVAAACVRVSRAIIVSSDKDLYQCLSRDKPRVEQYDLTTNKLLTHDWFVEHYGINPSQWPEVKAVAGCTSDNIRGVPEMGETRAIYYVQGSPKLSERLKKVVAKYKDRVATNRLLVTLPWEGLELPELREDEDDAKSWGKVYESLGMKSLIGSVV